MWRFWLVFPFIGLLIYLFFVSAMICMMRGGRMMCMGRHSHDSEETAGLRRPVEDLREQLEEASGDAVRGQHTEHGEGNLA
jgi:hypothetical protein